MTPKLTSHDQEYVTWLGSAGGCLPSRVLSLLSLSLSLSLWTNEMGQL